MLIIHVQRAPDPVKVQSRKASRGRMSVTLPGSHLELKARVGVLGLAHPTPKLHGAKPRHHTLPNSIPTSREAGNGGQINGPSTSQFANKHAVDPKVV